MPPLHAGLRHPGFNARPPLGLLHPGTVGRVPRIPFRRVAAGCGPYSSSTGPAQWVHNIQLIKGRPAVTLVLMGKRKRDWYFFSKRIGTMFWEGLH